MSGKKLFVTIDTEMDADPHWYKMWPPRFSSIYEGIPLFFRPLWDKYDVHPVYFLSPEILQDEKCCSILKDEISKGAVIGAHLHPEYIEPETIYTPGKKDKSYMFPCSQCSTGVEEAKIANLTRLISERLGVSPKWYRAARFGADEDTYKILDRYGYEHESSVTPGIDWSYCGGENYKDHPVDRYAIPGTLLTEHPVTILGKRWSVLGRLLPDNWLFYRWLRPTHMTYLGMRSVVREMLGRDSSELVMMFHSMEIMPNKAPYVRNKAMQKYYLWRLDHILAYAQRQGYEM